jgi:HEAT repeat protein
VRPFLCVPIVVAGLVAAGAPASPQSASSVAGLAAEDVRIRRHAAWALGQAAAPDTLGALARALGDPDELVARYAADSLIAIGAPAILPVLATFDECSRCSREGERVLGEIGAGAVPPLVERLGAPWPSARRRSAARVLGRIGPGAAEAVPALVAALDRTEQRADRVEIATALGQIGAAAVPALVARLDEDLSDEQRELLYRSLAAAGPAARPALPMLIASLRGEGEVALRYRAAIALGAIGDASAAPALIECLERDPSATVRMYAALALGDVPGDTARTVQALVAVLASGDTQVSPRAVASLAKLGAPAVPALVATLSGGNEDARGWAVLALGRSTAPRALTVPPLIEAFTDPSERVRDQTLQAVSEAGPGAVPWLVLALGKHEQASVRGHAALAVGHLDTPAPEALPALVAALADRDPHVRQLASWSVGRYGAEGLAAAPALVGALASDDPVLRRNAVWALGNIGPPAAASESAIRPLLDDPDPAVREEAAEALKKIHGAYTWN